MDILTMGAWAIVASVIVGACIAAGSIVSYEHIRGNPFNRDPYADLMLAAAIGCALAFWVFYELSKGPK